MPGIRPFIADDIGSVIALRRATFSVCHHSSEEQMATYMKQVFLENPWYSDECPSLVYESSDGKVTGFLGRIPRRMVYRNEPLNVVVATQIMVSPSSRGVAGLHLLRHAFQGPQDLLLSDAGNTPALSIWSGLGGSVCVTLSLIWCRPLRPARFTASSGGRSILARGFRLLSRPALNACDAAITRIPQSAYHLPEPTGELKPLTPEDVLDLLPDLARGRTLRPVYDETDLPWLFEKVQEASWAADLQQFMVLNSLGDVIGWFSYVPSDGGVAQVLQLVARKRSYSVVLDHLFRHAWHRGAVAIEGRLDPACLAEMAARNCKFVREGPWVLLHSKRVDVLETIHRGDALLTLLEGERWLCF